MNAEIAGSMVAKFIDCSWPEDRQKVLEVLTLGVNKAWQQGKWLGMTIEGFVPIQKDEQGQSYIITPNSHPVCLALNQNGKRMSMRDPYFMFHKNGYGDIRDTKECKWSKDVYDLGYVPTLMDMRLRFPKGFRIGVRSIGTAGAKEKININGVYLDGNKVFTYQRQDMGRSCGCERDGSDVETVNGISLDISTTFNYISNIKFADVSAITKTFTRTPVEVCAIDDNQNVTLIARLDPNQRVSKYRKYLVPDAMCHQHILHGIFKIAQQEDLVSDTDPLIISNREALVCFAKGVYQIYYKEQIDFGASFITQGIGILDKEKQEEESPSEFPIQVEVEGWDGLPDSLRYSS